MCAPQIPRNQFYYPDGFLHNWVTFLTYVPSLNPVFHFCEMLNGGCITIFMFIAVIFLKTRNASSISREWINDIHVKWRSMQFVKLMFTSTK